MPSGNKVLGRVYRQFIDLKIYISPRIVTEGLCGSFDGNRSNDVVNRHTNQTFGTIVGREIERNTSDSWL